MGDESRPLFSKHGVNAEEKKPFILFDPNRKVFRFTVLFFVCFLTFGSYYCYDNPGALQGPIQEKFGNISSFEYEALYSVYSWPNTVLVFFGGFLLDRIGLRLGAFIFCALVGCGQIIFAIGATVQGLPGYGIALAGRFVFGLGGESLSVAQSTYSAKWFRGNELAMAFGIALSFSRLGSAVNFNVEPAVDEALGLSAAIWLGAIICGVSIGSAIVLAILDSRGEKNAVEVKEVKAEEPVSLLDVRHFPLSIWLIFGICVTFYVSMFVWITLASTYLQKYWGMSKGTAGHLVSIPYFVSAGASPILGFIVDRVGRAVWWMIGACAVMTCVHVSLSIYPFEHLTPIPALVIQGLAYSVLAAALWPSVALLVDMKILGTAFGLMTALQNAGLAIAPLIVGAVTNKFGYRAALYIFAGCSGTATILCVCLLFADLAADKILNSSAVRVKAIVAEKQKSADLVGDHSLSYSDVEVDSTVFAPRNATALRSYYFAKLGLNAPAGFTTN